MRHRKSGRKLGMDNSARKAMFRNMVTSLMLHGTIRTTRARAKELRGFADKVISLGKKAPTPDQIASLKGDDRQVAQARRVHLIRRARLWVNNDDALNKVFGEYADRFRARPGGYTRVVKAGIRPGDSAPMAVIQLVEAFDPAAAPKRTAPETVFEQEAPPAEEAPVVEAAADDDVAEEAEAEAASDDQDAAGDDATA